MDPIVTAALIAVVPVTVSTVVAVMAEIRKSKALEEKKKTEEALVDLGAKVSTEAAYTIDRLEVAVGFDDTGKGTNRKRWIGLRCNQNIQNLRIAFEFRAPRSSARIVSIEGRELASSALPALPTENERTDHVSRGTFLISGQSGPETGPVSFYLLHGFEGAYYLTQKEVEEAYKNDDWHQEYVTLTVLVPTSHIVLEVTFPPSHRNLRPEPSAVTFIAHTETVHHHESMRIKDYLTLDEDGKATLSVPSPKLGLSYAISWMPP